MPGQQTGVDIGQSSVPAIAYLTASQIRSVIILLSPTYVPQNWHVCLIMVGLLLFSCMAAILWKRSLRTVAILVAVFHFLALIGCIATGLATEHFAERSFVWQNDQSPYTGSTSGISFCIGFLTMAFAFAGWLLVIDHASQDDDTNDYTQVAKVPCILLKRRTVQRSQCLVR